MTWQWVVLILGLMWALVALVVLQGWNQARLDAHKLQYLDPTDIRLSSGN